MSRPYVHAFLLADKVFREAETGKVHIAGTFNRIGATQFPFHFPQLYIYLALSDLKAGTHEIVMEIRHLELNKSILKIHQPMESPGPLDVIEIIVCFNRVPIEDEGNVEITVNCGLDFIASRNLSVMRKDQPGG